jgi:hypothetical protein
MEEVLPGAGWDWRSPVRCGLIRGMTLTKLLNCCYRFKGFIYEEAGFAEQRANAIEVQVRPRKGSRPYCSGCGKRRGAYDRLPERRFEFIPVWGFAVFFRYARRRVDCRECGIVAELLPWANGKQTLTNAYMQFLANWARKLSWAEVAQQFHSVLPASMLDYAVVRMLPSRRARRCGAEVDVRVCGGAMRVDPLRRCCDPVL